MHLPSMRPPAGLRYRGLRFGLLLGLGLILSDCYAAVQPGPGGYYNAPPPPPPPGGPGAPPPPPPGPPPPPPPGW